MLILGIETSCDETACAIVENGTKVFSSIIASSSDIHAITGGIIPENAARRQIESIIPVIKETLDKAFPKSVNLKSQVSYLDAIAITCGPGLVGSLLVGIETAKTLSYLWKKPLIPVNHLIAHIYANWIQDRDLLSVDSKPSTDGGQLMFPALALIVSGGHTDIVLMKEHGNTEWIGGTRDDAAGEAFDKCARLLGLSYPGGPSISAEAVKCSSESLNLFPRPMINSDNFDWSFSGLKTSVSNYVKSNPASCKLKLPELASEVQEAIVEVLVTKSVRAIIKYKPKSFFLSGGVAANKRLRESLKLSLKKLEIAPSLYVPKTKYCTDNAAMTASAAYFVNNKTSWKEIAVNPQLDLRT